MIGMRIRRLRIGPDTRTNISIRSSTCGERRLTIRIGVILPSRGLEYSEAEQSRTEELNRYGRGWPGEGWLWKIFYAHKLDCPECHNAPLMDLVRFEEEHSFRFSRVWWVEDDIVFPPGMFRILMDRLTVESSKDEKIIGISPQTWVSRPPDWKKKQCSPAMTWDHAGHIDGCGLYSFLHRRSLLDSFKMPLFSPENKIDVPVGRAYNGDLWGVMGQDWRWQTAIKALGFRCIAARDLEVKHLVVKNFKEPGVNRWTWNGVHEIVDQKAG
jgi:hypothetical protein